MTHVANMCGHHRNTLFFSMIQYIEEFILNMSKAPVRRVR